MQAMTSVTVREGGAKRVDGRTVVLGELEPLRAPKKKKIETGIHTSTLQAPIF